jgi:hypothetical protein
MTRLWNAVSDGMISKASPTKSRSRTGCFTCRKRRKKCDESDYPICKNCQIKRLNCEWPISKQEFHKKLQQVRYVDNESKETQLDKLYEPEKPKKNTHILQLIGLQQDFVNDQDPDTSNLLPPTNHLEPNTHQHTQKTVDQTTPVDPDPSKSHQRFLDPFDILSDDILSGDLMGAGMFPDTTLSQLTTLEPQLRNESSSPNSS